MRMRPNIVLIMTDQQRADFSRAAGFALDTTPYLDTLSRQGTRFSGAYTPMPVCAPARCSVFSGRYPTATRVRDNGGIANVVKTGDLVSMLREQGYSTNLVGKNHSFLTNVDFDFYAAPYGHRDGPPERTSKSAAEFEDWLKEIQYVPQPQATPFPLEHQLAYRIVNDAIDCIDGLDNRPFFLWLSFPEPHNPYQVPEPYFSMFPEQSLPPRVAGPEAARLKGGKWLWMRELLEAKHPGYDERWLRYRANYCGMLRMLDDQVKRFVDHLIDVGMYDDTVFIFCSDHGDFAGDYGLQRKGIDLPECLVRVPLFLRWTWNQSWRDHIRQLGLFSGHYANCM